jgi:hypothetical protein
MSQHTPQLVLISGLGADERLLAPQREAFPDAIIPPWLPPRTSDGLPEYAARLAETLPLRPAVDYRRRLAGRHDRLRTGPATVPIFMRWK